MKIIVKLLMIVLLIFNTQALNISNSRRARTSSEASAYMAAFKKLNFSNGYKLFGTDFTQKSKILYVDISIEGKNIIDEKKTDISFKTSDLASATNSLTFQFNSEFIQKRKNFESLTKIDSNAIAPEFKEFFVENKFTLDFAKTGNVHIPEFDKTKMTFGYEQHRAEVQTLTFNFREIVEFSDLKLTVEEPKASPDEINRMAFLIEENRKLKLEAYQTEIKSMIKTIVNLKSNIKQKILLLGKEKDLIIIKKQIADKTIELEKCKRDYSDTSIKRAALIHEYERRRQEYKDFSQTIIDCARTIQKYEIEIENTVQKISQKGQVNAALIQTRESEQRLAKTAIFYWIQASFYYRIFNNLLIQNEKEIEEKFNENNIKKSCENLSKAFLPWETDLGFLNPVIKKDY